MSTMDRNQSGDDVARYDCFRTPVPIEIDGNLGKAAWQNVPQSPRFVDMVTGGPGLFDTRAAALWDDERLYIAFWVQEPFVEATLSERDSIIFSENDVEVFIDGGDCYYELEINALNTLYEVLFVWKDAVVRGGRFDRPDLDLYAPTALTFGGDYDRKIESFWRGTHPRGPRWAFRDWDFPGLETAVRVDGTINESSDIDRGWTAEIFLPWKGMELLAGDRHLPPRDGDEWRLFFGRFEKLVFSGEEVSPHPAWVWSCHGVYDTHLPDRFPRVRFVDQVTAGG